jgi:DNA polymerase-3 subunit delta
MGAAPGQPPLRVAWGDDEFAVQRRARQIFESWTSGELAGAGDSEVIDARSANSEEALRAIARLREALQSLPFFGGRKAIWFRDCNFVGEDRVSEAQAVVEATTGLVKSLGTFDWRDTRLLITAGKLDRRRTFYKTLEEFAETGAALVEHFPGLTQDDRDWQDRASAFASAEFKALGKRIGAAALRRFVEFVGPQSRQLAMEAQKAAAHVGDRDEIRMEDVEAVTTRGRHARAFALGEFWGERNLPKALAQLENELWMMRSDKQRTEVGLLYALISKVRTTLLAREMLEEGLLRPTSDYRAFQQQLARLPADRFPSDKRYNPIEIKAYPMFRAVQHARNYSRQELVDAMGELLRCNLRLVGSTLDGGLALQLAMTRIMSRGS